MKKSPVGTLLKDEQVRQLSGGTYSPGIYREEAKAFLKKCLGEEKFSQILPHGNAKMQLYVAARIFLTSEEWEQYKWIETFGSLDGFK